MSRFSFALFAAALLALFTVGCAPSPDEVCKHVETLDAKAGGGMCSFKWQEMRDTKHARYKKLAPCVMEAKDKDSFNKCLEQNPGD